jgi:hypothetical protein
LRRWREDTTGAQQNAEKECGRPEMGIQPIFHVVRILKDICKPVNWRVGISEYMPVSILLGSAELSKYVPLDERQILLLA